MRISYRLRVFLLLTGALVLGLAAWSLYRYTTHAPQREAWAAVTNRLGAQAARIDSLAAAVDSLETEVDAGRESLESIGERIGHYERRASGGTLPTPQYRRYMRAIEAHNEVVERHNHDVSELKRVYARYSALVDSHNALIDSANSLQRTAAQEGYRLPRTDLR